MFRSPFRSPFRSAVFIVGTAEIEVIADAEGKKSIKDSAEAVVIVDAKAFEPAFGDISVVGEADGRKSGKGSAEAVIEIPTDADGKKSGTGSVEAVVEAAADAVEGKKAVGDSAEAVIFVAGEAIERAIPDILLEAEADGSVTGRNIYFIEKPRFEIRGIAATHVTVKSPDAEYTASLEGVVSEERVDRVIKIDAGDSGVCEAVAKELLDRWGKKQVTVTGKIPLTVTLRFKDKVRIIIPGGGLDEELILQRKKHNLSEFATEIVAGDIQLTEHELIARALEELT